MRTVPVPHDAPRLDRFLASALGISRSAAEKIIELGTVERNGKKLKAHTPVRAGDALEVTEPLPVTVPIPPEPRVIAENPEYVVLDKPSGLTVHPGPGIVGPTLVNWLMRQYPEIATQGGDRPGIVHRLDRDISGLLVVARTPASLAFLQRAFVERTVEKHYLALVAGRVERPEGEIVFALARSKTKPGRTAARPHSAEGREALTRYTVLASDAHRSYLDLELVTGRTHQLRAHLQAFGHPIEGDTAYGGTNKHLARPFLHAAALTLPEQGGERRTFRSHLPPDLAALLATLLPAAVDPVKGIGRNSD